MLRFTLLLIVLAGIGCIPSNEDCLTDFNSHLSADHSQLLTELTQKFGSYIKELDEKNFADNYRSFLTQMAVSDELYSKVPKDLDLKKRVLQLDTMIFKYEHFENDRGEQRKFIQTHINSDYILALVAVQDCNNLIADYVNTIQETGGVSPALIAAGVSYSYRDEDFNNPVLQRILAVELYLPYLTYEQ